MAYRIRPGRNAAKELRKAALERLGKAIQALCAEPAERAEGVHQARKRFKELRALLRLVREPLGARFAVDNRRLRDAGRRLAESRDASAMLESWEALARRNHPLFVSEPFRQIRAGLQQRAAPDGEVHAEFETEVAQVLSELHALTQDVRHWKLAGKGFGLVAGGLRRTYADGVRELARAEKDGTDELLHEWRKRVKDHWYHCQLLSPCWPAALDSRVDQLKQVADALGDDHDLAMMLQLMQREPELFGMPETREELQRCIERRRAQLQQQALRLGRRLYAEAPNALQARIGAYWRIARAEQG
ncbi:CHAD domain-containing protein [Stutzerimonas stutzeri]|uniref:CHAD domain-containing protein n=1 Tax=Stutzerimonas sp. S1 TaxID=3030652 RepID=UPI002223F37E|nr:CHAD domain-containing protein [Stutzerimonas sp. S1]MCW3150083.1 CHAD domain-containing protein [Stutzerimonas sp. S1]